MQQTTSIFCGKGGVGKTNSAVSRAVYISETKGESVALIDYDGGHSVKSSLRVVQSIKQNSLSQIDDNLFIATIDDIPFRTISECKNREESFREYIAQFEEDYGLIPFYDMAYEFFAMLTDISTAQRFITLTRLLAQSKKLGVKNIIIDVEPTAGLERLLAGADSLIRSLTNLKYKSKLLLMAISAGGWPDIAKFLKSDYIKNIDVYTAKMEVTLSVLKGAQYALVCTPEHIPVMQSFSVRTIIEKFGGKVKGYVINNTAGQRYEKENLAIIYEQNLPVVEIPRELRLHDKSISPYPLYRDMGKKISTLFN